jgi:hypothetical protein
MSKRISKATNTRNNQQQQQKPPMDVILAMDEIMRKGLKLAGFDYRRQWGVRLATNVELFKA